MAYINLLPWREVARKEQQKQYVIILGFLALLSFLIVFLINLFYNARIEGQNARNQYLQNEIQILDSRIAEIRNLNEAKQRLQQRMSLIEHLQRSRNLGTQIMDEIARIVPAGVYLTQLEKKELSLLLIGKTESNNRLSNMLRQAENSELINSPLLEFIETAAGERLLSNFKLHFRIADFNQQTDAKTPANRAGSE